MNVNYERPESTQDHPGPYKVVCECNFPVDPDTLCGITFVAIIDTGSPISLLKRELLPNNSDVIKPLDNSCNFSGINGTKLELLGIFETEIFIHGDMFNLRFYIVPGNTMVMNAILGRDFVNKPNSNLCFQNGSARLNVVDNINRMSGTESLQQNLCVDYEHEFESVKEIININPKIEFTYRNELLELYNDEYVLGKRCLQDNTDPNLEMKIILKHDQPISYRARRISYSDRERLKTIIDDLLKGGIIRPSRSPYNSPILLVRKKTGDLRLCVDYRELNKITVKDNFPAPLIDDQIDKLKNKKYFSLLDLKNGFHHVKMNEASIPFTSFNNNSNKTNNSNTPSPNSAENNGWTTQTTKRAHSSSSYTSDPPLSPQEIQHVKKKLFSSRNRYEVFSSIEQSPNHSAEDAQTACTDSVANPIIKPIIPPPIFLRGVADFPSLCTELIDLIGVDNFHCKSTTDRLKIQTANPESYRALVQFLRKENAEFHTYQLQEEKPIRVVIRNIHPTTPCELIKEELVLRLFEVRQVTPVLHRLNKTPLPPFFVDLEPTHHSNEIFQLTSLLHTKIIVEEPHKPKSISQCANCQDYGHTCYCGYSPRCVRCGNDHHSSSCPNSRDEPPRCALCQENHPASYKDCSIYKNLQRRKNPNTINNKNLTVKTNSNLKFKSKNVQDSHPSNSSMHLPDQPITYADATSGLSSKPVPPPQVPLTSPTVTDINTLMASFLNEFKTLINPLISLLTKVITTLLDKKND
ncbi:hypothetical protein QTP88_026686 [Uroleucon formosanum]